MRSLITRRPGAADGRSLRASDEMSLSRRSERGMEAKLLNPQGQKTYAIIFDKGDEFMAGVRESAQQEHLGAASFTAIGAFSSVTLGYFDRERMDYKQIPVDEQVEVLALVGDIARHKDKPEVHAHVVLGRS